MAEMGFGLDNINSYLFRNLRSNSKFVIMKTGMESILGLGFIAAMAGLASQSKAMEADMMGSPFVSRNSNYGSPAYITRNPNRKRKQNRLRLSHNAKLKRRKSA